MRVNRVRGGVVATCAVAIAGLTSCEGDAVEIVKPTPRSAYASTYPCELLTRRMARELLSVPRVLRIGAQSFPDGTQQCIWAPGLYRQTPQVALLLSPSTRIMRRSVAERQVRAAALWREAGMPRRPAHVPAPRYGALRGLGDRAFLTSEGRISTTLVVEQDGRSFELRLHLKQKPRSQPPPLAALEALARQISERYVRPPG